MSPPLRQLWDDLRRHDSVLWRRAVSAGVTYGPDALVRYSPPLFGLAFAAALPHHRHLVEKNLRLALGPRPRLRELADVAGLFVNYAGSLTDAFVAGTDRHAPLTVTCVDEGPVSEAVREGKGMIIATAHTGGWQVAGLQLQSLLGADMMVVMGPERDPRAQALSDAVRARAGVRVAHLGEDPLGVLALLGHLRRGGIVAMQMDRLPQGMRGRKSELFGEPFSVPEGPLRLAAASGAPIVPVFTRRLGYMAYEVQVAPAVRLPRRPAPADLDAAARAVLQAMEIFVRENPTQWFHFE